MATVVEPLTNLKIGSTAGLIWSYLDKNGPATLSRLARDLDVPRDRVMQAVGWLAREDKIRFEDGPRARQVVLT